jgi:beta-phosphoglucomutase-like phosphatase (HAD superfamily)
MIGCSPEPLGPDTADLALRFDGVIFDFDGTLVDTMDLHFRAYRTAFAAIGCTLTAERFHEVVGGKASETIPRMVDRPLSAAEVQAVHVAKRQALRPLFLHGPIRCLGPSLLLPLLHGRVPLALASSGSREGIALLLVRLGWMKFFDAVLTGEDAPVGKPAPDIFLKAAYRLNVLPGRCLAFEDTAAGLTAARTAGMTAIDVRLGFNQVARLVP